MKISLGSQKFWKSYELLKMGGSMENVTQPEQ